MLTAIQRACQCSPENAWLRREWLKTIWALLSEDPLPEIDLKGLPEQFAATRRAVAPYAHIVQVHARRDVNQMLDEAVEALEAKDYATASTIAFQLSNVISPHATLDQRYVRRHPLEFVLEEFQPAFYEAVQLSDQEPETPIAVSFKSREGAFDDSVAAEPLSAALDMAIVDFNLDGFFDIVALGPKSVVVWSRKSPQDRFQPIAAAEASGFTRLLAQDLDADFDETFKAVFPDFDAAKSKQLPTLKNVCPTADVDVLLYGAAGVLLLENRYDLATKERTLAPVAADKLPGELKNVKTAAAADLEADGKLDLVFGDDNGLHLWSYLGDWKFVDISSRSVLPDKTLEVTQLLPVDWDRDVDIDLLVASPTGAGYLENLRHGQFRWRAFDGDFAPLKTSRWLEALEVDGNASWDLVAAVEEGLLLVTTTTPSSGVVRFGSAELLTKTTAAGLLTWDYDNDGHDDLLAWGEGSPQLLRGGGKFSSVDLLAGVKELAQAVASDLDNDGDLDLVALASGGVTLLDNDGGNANHWLNVALQAQQNTNESAEPSGRVSPYGNGTLLELKAGRRYQAKVVRGQVTHFGLGKATQADVVRVLWVNGVPQNILQPAADAFICEQQLLHGSCPYLYAWNGKQFDFCTDLLWNAPLGLQFAEGVLAQPREWEYLKIPGEQLAAKDGQYSLQLTEELWEAAYFDEVKLIAIDHPAEVSIYSNEKVGPAEISQFKVHTAREPRSPLAARNHNGRDLLPDVARQDGVYARVHDKKLQQGVTEDTWLELDLGDVRGARQITLFMTGWLYPSGTAINVALSRGGPVAPGKPPALLIPDGADRWKEAMPFTGFPGGKTKTIAIDLSGQLAENDGRIRIATSMEFYWDQIFFTVDEPPAEVRTTELDLVAADLHYRGFSKVVPDTGNGPEDFFYDDVSTAAKWPTMAGVFTRYGDVLPLLKESDDRLVVMGAGDEISLRLAAPQEPLPAGWKRDFFIYNVGWDKDCNLLTVLGETADPLPRRGVGGYPTPEAATEPQSKSQLSRTQPPGFWKAIQRWE
jgi:hypothetical protein